MSRASLSLVGQENTTKIDTKGEGKSGKNDREMDGMKDWADRMGWKGLRQ